MTIRTVISWFMVHIKGYGGGGESRGDMGRRDREEIRKRMGKGDGELYCLRTGTYLTYEHTHTHSYTKYAQRSTLMRAALLLTPTIAHTEPDHPPLAMTRSPCTETYSQAYRRLSWWSG